MSSQANFEPYDSSGFGCATVVTELDAAGLSRQVPLLAPGRSPHFCNFASACRRWCICCFCRLDTKSCAISENSLQASDGSGVFPADARSLLAPSYTFAGIAPLTGISLELHLQCQSDVRLQAEQSELSDDGSYLSDIRSEDFHDALSCADDSGDVYDDPCMVMGSMGDAGAEIVTQGVRKMEAQIQELFVKAVSSVEGLATEPFWQRSGHHFLRRCLRARDFDHNAALQLLQRFVRFRQRQKWPLTVSLKDGDDGADVLRALFSGVHWILPRKDSDGRSVVVLRPGQIEGPVEPFHRMGVFVMQWATGLVPQEDDAHTYLSGADMFVTMIVDLTGCGVGIVTRFGKSDIERGIRMWQDCFPLKLRAIYLVNAGRVICGALEFAKKLLEPKLRGRIESFDARHVSGPNSLADLRARLGGCAMSIPREWGGYLDFSSSDAHANHHGDGNAGGWASVVNAQLERARLARATWKAHSVPCACTGHGSQPLAYKWWEDWVALIDDG